LKILGISAFYHDSAAAYIENGEIVAAAQEERFTRVKHDPAFPAHAVRYCLSEAGIQLSDLDAIVFYDCHSCVVKGKNVFKADAL
jgi:carbamoyltransferase